MLQYQSINHNNENHQSINQSNYYNQVRRSSPDEQAAILRTMKVILLPILKRDQCAITTHTQPSNKRILPDLVTDSSLLIYKLSRYFIFSKRKYGKHKISDYYQDRYCSMTHIANRHVMAAII